MTNIVRNTMLAAALLGGAALISAPALASPHGNSWNKSSQNDDSYSRHNRSYGYNRDRSYGYNRNPGYAYNGPHSYYGSRYGYGSRDYDAGPGLSFTIR